MDVDWIVVEDTVFNNASRCAQQFATTHSGERFYGLFLDCNAMYFELLFHLNTEELLRQQAVASMQARPDLYRGVTLSALVEELRWSGGDWGYFEAFRADGHDEAYDRLIGELILHFTTERRGISSDVYERFLEMACRVAVRLERGAALTTLPRTPDFRVLCADHDETVDAGEQRLCRIRALVP